MRLRASLQRLLLLTVAVIAVAVMDPVLGQQTQFAPQPVWANSSHSDETEQPEAPVPSVPEFLTQDDLSPILSRLNELESRREERDSSGVEYLETPSVDSLRVVNGRLHVDEWGFPVSSSGVNLIENGDPNTNPKNRVLLRRVRLSVAGKVPPENVSYHLDLEFSGTDRGQVRDAWVGLDDLHLLNTVRIGNQKRPYGLNELNSSNFMTFLERPFVVSAFNEENRRFGIMTYGTTPDQRYNWRFGGFHLRQFQSTGSIVDNLDEVELAGRLASTTLFGRCDGRDYFHLAIAGSVGFPSPDPNDTTARRRTRPEARSESRWLDTGPIDGARVYELLALESVLNIGRASVSAEYMNLWMQREDDAGSDLFLHGGYVSATYMLTDDYQPWNPELGILGRLKPSSPFIRDQFRQQRGPGAWQIAARFSLGDFNDADIRGGLGKSATIGLNWYLNSHTRWQFNYLFGRIDDRQLTGLNPSIVSGHYQIIGTRIMLDF